MARIVIINWFNKSLEVGDLSRSVLQHLQDNRLDWMHSCGGKGRCTTCKFRIVDHAENFLELTVAEERYRKQRQLTTYERLSCQAKIKGDVVIAVPEEYKFPHIRYDP
jgi:ferredoxin, 2Fe-2S